MVRAFAHGAMGRRIDPLWSIHLTISRSSQCSTTGVTKAVVCAILSVGVIHITLLAARSEMLPRGKSIRSWSDGSSDRSFMVDPLSYFSFQPVLHDWCNKGHGMCYPVCGMVHIKQPLLLIGKSSLCGGCEFPLSLSEWSFTICLKPYNSIKMCSVRR